MDLSGLRGMGNPGNYSRLRVSSTGRCVCHGTAIGNHEGTGTVRGVSTMQGYEISSSQAFARRARRLIFFGELLVGVGGIALSFCIAGVVVGAALIKEGRILVIALGIITFVSFGVELFIRSAWPIWQSVLRLPFVFADRLRREWCSRNVKPSLYDVENWISDTIVLDRDGEPVWLGLTDARLLFLSYNDQKLLISQELDPVKITEIKEEQNHRSGGCLAFLGLAFLATLFLSFKDQPGFTWIAVASVIGILLIGMWVIVPIHNYTLKISDGQEWELSFIERSIGSSAKEFVSELREVMQVRKSWHS
jgi:hypothetical protein